MNGPVDLLDANVWLALSLPDHPHHERARRYWFQESGEEVAFCRVTALGFVRLCTHSRVMAGRPLTVSRAWQAYAAFRRLPEVLLAAEPVGCEDRLAAWALGKNVHPRLWTDAYLACFAQSAGFRLVSFDRDFSRFQDLDLLSIAG